MILHEITTDDGSILSVRSAGKSRRLYRNGIFHTQWHPDRVFEESVWTLLAVSSLFATAAPRRCLLLGVAGGAVLHSWHRLWPDAALTGIELCPYHVAVGRQWFGLDAPHIDLQQGDAQQWLTEYDGPAFDVIVEDCFDTTNPSVDRALPLDAAWCTTLARHLAPSGVLAINAGGLGDLRSSALMTHAALRRRFRSRSALSVRDELNRIGVFTETAVQPRLAQIVNDLSDQQLRRQLSALHLRQRAF